MATARTASVRRQVSRAWVAAEPRAPAKGLVIGGLEAAAQLAAEYGIQLSNCDFIDPHGQSAESLSTVPDEAFDLLVADGALQDQSRLNVTLANWIRVVRPSGRIVLLVPDGSTSRANGSWQFVIQEPSVGPRQANLLELIQVVCHLVEVERLTRREGRVQRNGGDNRLTLTAAEPNGEERAQQNGGGNGELGPIVEIVLRKRSAALAPVQSNHTTEVQVLGKLTRSAITARALWRPMDEFDALLRSGVVEATVVDTSRLYLLYQWLLSTLSLPGHFIEVGCYRGGTAKLIAEVLARRNIAGKLHLFDTFNGMPERLANDEAGLKGTFADTSLQQVRRLIGDNPHVRYHRGIFPDSVPSYLNRRRFRFAHIDVDIERSVHDALGFVYPRLVTGGVIIIDDYGHPECPGATRAAERYFADTSETIVQMPLISSAVVVKRDAAVRM